MRNIFLTYKQEYILTYALAYIFLICRWPATWVFLHTHIVHRPIHFARCHESPLHVPLDEADEYTLVLVIDCLCRYKLFMMMVLWIVI